LNFTVHPGVKRRRFAHNRQDENFRVLTAAQIMLSFAVASGT
jgi:hypothetical protein